jgi:AsmA protein
MKDLADKDLLEGRGNVALDVSSRGDSVAAMKKALGGTASLSLKDGAIKGINLAQSLRDIKGKLGRQSRMRRNRPKPATRRTSPN